MFAGVINGTGHQLCICVAVSHSRAARIVQWPNEVSVLEVAVRTEVVLNGLPKMCLAENAAQRVKYSSMFNASRLLRYVSHKT